MPLLEFRGLDNDGGVLGIEAGVKVAVRTGLLGGDQSDPRHQVHEIAPEQFQISVNGADLEFAVPDELGQFSSLWAGKGKVDFSGDAFCKDIQVGRQGDDRLNHMQVVNQLRVHTTQ